jgi:hypothetical protein
MMLPITRRRFADGRSAASANAPRKKIAGSRRRTRTSAQSASARPIRPTGASQSAAVWGGSDDRDLAIGVVDAERRRPDDEAGEPSEHRERGQPAEQERRFGDRVVDGRYVFRREPDPADGPARHEIPGGHRENDDVLGPKLPASSKREIVEEDGRDQREAALLAEERRHGREPEPDHPADPARARGVRQTRPAEEASQHAARRQQVGASDHVGDRLGRDRVHGEQERGDGRRPPPPRQVPDERVDEPGAGDVQDDVLDDVARRAIAVADDGVVDQKRQDGQRAVEPVRRHRLPVVCVRIRATPSTVTSRRNGFSPTRTRASKTSAPPGAFP